MRSCEVRATGAPGCRCPSSAESPGCALLCSVLGSGWQTLEEDCLEGCGCEKRAAAPESLPLLPGSAGELSPAPRPIASLQTTKARHTHQGRLQGRENKGETLGKVGTLKTKRKHLLYCMLVQNHCSFPNSKLQLFYGKVSLSLVDFGGPVFGFEADLLLVKIILWSRKCNFFFFFFD